MAAKTLNDAATFAIDVATVLGGAAALLALAAAVRAGYRRTLGRRRDRYERLERLGTGAQLAFFITVLGEPPAIRQTVVNDHYVEILVEGDPAFDAALADPVSGTHTVETTRPFTQCIFIDRDFYVQTISDDDETVLAFSVTSRRRRFAPTFEGPMKFGRIEKWRIRRRIGEKWLPLFRLKLGHTRCSEIEPDGPPPAFQIFSGARLFAYSEFHYWGNPGSYQTYVFSASSAAGPAPVGEPWAVREEVGGGAWDPEADTPWSSMSVTHKFRRETAITTYTVVAHTLGADNFPTTFGPHADLVRTLP